MLDFSVIIPVYNEQENIPVLVGLLRQELDRLTQEYEIILVDDASFDQSLLTIRQIANKDARIKFLSFSRNFGQQAALTAGLDYASGKAVISMDADLQDPPDLIPEMIKSWQSGNDIVLMRRKHRSDGFLKRITANFYYALLNRFSDYKFPANVGEFRLLDRKVVMELRNMKEKSRYLRGMIFWLGYTYTIIDYDRPNRTKGVTGFSFLKMARLGMNGILNFSLLPLRVGLILGVLIVTVGTIFLLYVFYDAVFNHMEYPLYKWLSITTFILTGFLFILIWILGEYIGKIYNEVKNRPIYLIREKGNF